MDAEDSFPQKQSCPWQGEDHSGRKSLYKRTPKGWKEKFRKGCIQRLRQNRDKLVQKLRCNDNEKTTTSSEKSQEFIDELMNAEFEEIKDLNEGRGQLCACCFSEDADGEEEGIDNILKVMDEIRQELIKEEQKMLKEYNDLVNFDENYLCAAIECLGTDYVICPICKRNQLMQNKQVLFCSCGLRIDTGYDGITLSHVKSQIEEALKQHGCICTDEAAFSVLLMEELELHNLVLQCKKCNFMEIVV